MKNKITILKKIAVICLLAIFLGIGGRYSANVFAEPPTEPPELTRLYLPEHFTMTEWPAGSGRFTITGFKSAFHPSNYTNNLYLDIPTYIPAYIGDTSRTVVAISQSAFAHITNIAKVAIPNGVTEIPVSAFEGASSLNSVVLPAYLERINNRAFYGCRLTSIDFPDTLRYIGHSAFRHNHLTLVDFPDLIEVIRQSSFQHNVYLQEVSLPANLKVIEQWAFENCGLLSIEFPTSLTSIVGGAFGRNYLTSVRIPDGITLIDGSTFTSNRLTEVILPEGLKEICHNAFSHNLITEIVFPDSLTRLGVMAFWGNQINKLTIPANVDLIDLDAFLDNPIREIVFAYGATEIVGSSFNNIGETLVRVVIPSTILEIGLTEEWAVDIDRNAPVSVWLASSANWTRRFFDGRYELYNTFNRRRVPIILKQHTPFDGNPNVVIYAQHETRPYGWYDGFNDGTTDVIIWNISWDMGINVQADGGGQIDVVGTIGLEHLPYGAERTFVATPNQWWRFVRWEVSGTDEYDYHDNELTVTFFDENVTVVAVFEEIRFNINFSNMFESLPGLNPIDFTVSTPKITLVEPTNRDGWNFIGWFDAPDFGSQVHYIESGKTTDITIYARWELATYEIEFGNLYDATHGFNPLSFTMQTPTITLLDPTSRIGWDFVGWFDALENGEQVFIIEAGTKEDVRIYARWELTTFEISFANLFGTDPSANPTEFTMQTQTFDFVAPTQRVGWEFVGWFTAPDIGEQILRIEYGSIGNIMIFARWQEVIKTVTFNSLGGYGGYTPQQNVQYRVGSVDEQYTTKTGYKLIGWSIYNDTYPIDDRVLFDFETDIVDGMITLYAVWVPILHTVTFDSLGGEAGYTKTQYIQYRLGQAESQYTTKTGYVLVGWSIFDDTYPIDERTLFDFENEIVTEPITLYAVWVAYSPNFFINNMDWLIPLIVVLTGGVAFMFVFFIFKRKKKEESS